MKETSFKAGVIGDDLSKEAYLEMYLKETNPIICESDDEFINMCKQIKGK